MREPHPTVAAVAREAVRIYQCGENHRLVRIRDLRTLLRAALREAVLAGFEDCASDNPCHDADEIASRLMGEERL